MSDVELNPSCHDAATRRAFAEHSRLWRDFTYVYPVISRRSRGLSIGINLNPDGVCNFDCVYCCVDRTVGKPLHEVDLARIAVELKAMLARVNDGEIWRQPEFAPISPEYRRLNDVAFSGDGEPSVFTRIDEAVEIAAREVGAMRSHPAFADAKIVMVTNATGLDRPVTKRALEIMDRNQGEVWGKLDAGTQEYYRAIDRTNFPLSKVLANLLECGRHRPIVVQTMLLRMHGTPMPPAEFEAYIHRLESLIRAGCRVKLVQLYTVARATAERYVSPMDEPSLTAMAQRLRVCLPGVPVVTFV